MTHVFTWVIWPVVALGYSLTQEEIEALQARGVELPSKDMATPMFKTKVLPQLVDLYCRQDEEGRKGTVLENVLRRAFMSELSISEVCAFFRDGGERWEAFREAVIDWYCTCVNRALDKCSTIEPPVSLSDTGGSIVLHLLCWVF